jgi:hypothetical protein
MRRVQAALAIVAAVFGIATIVAGVRVLAGGDPGYVVFRPLVVYNALMGLAYVAAGILGWRDARRGAHAAAAILVLNAVVLAVVGYLFASGAAVAEQSVQAMAFRTVVWFVLFLGFAWAAKRASAQAHG